MVQGGHGSSPQHAKAPIVMAGMAIMQYQTIVSRQIDPSKTGVLTIGSVQEGVDNNVIPTEATLKLKLHYSNTEIREQLVKSINLISNNIAKSYGVSEEMMPSVIHKEYAPAIVNTDGFISQIHQVLNEKGVTEHIIDDYKVSGSDDANALIEGVKNVESAYLMIGTANPKLFKKASEEGKEFPFFLHEPTYQVDLGAIPYGAIIATTI